MGAATAQVIPFPKPEPSTFAEAWSLLTDDMRRRSEAKAKVQILWDREAKRLGGQQVLLGRLRTYLRDDKDVRRTGGPGFQVLLRAGRLDHWQPMQDFSSPSGLNVFPDAEIRRQVRGYLGEAWCRSYLDPCQMAGTTLIVRTDYAIGKFREHARFFKSLGLTGMRKSSTRDVGDWPCAPNSRG